jgi:uridine phosphorylase
VAGRFDKIVKKTNNRGLLTITGLYRGIGITAATSGMGCPSAAIATEELARIGAKTIIRLGTCGALRKGMKVGDMVVVTSAIGYDGTTREYLGGKIDGIPADGKVVGALEAACREGGLKPWVGKNRTHDLFYEPTKLFISQTKGKGYVSSEMECSVVFYVAQQKKLRAGAILVVNTVEVPEEIEKNPKAVYELIDADKFVEKAIDIALDAIEKLHAKK